MSNVVNLFVGQFGAVLGSSFLDEIAKEHSIIPGRKPSPVLNTEHYPDIFFDKEYNMQARAGYVDFKDAKGLGSLNSSYFNKQFAILADEADDGSPFQKISVGFNEKLDKLVKTLSEKQDKISAFQIFCGALDGSSAILDEFSSMLTTAMSKTPKLAHMIFDIDSQQSDLTRLNQLVSGPGLIEHYDFVNLAEKGSLKNAAVKNNIQPDNPGIFYAKAIADITSGPRSNGQCTYTLPQLIENPYPRVHFYSTLYSQYGEFRDFEKQEYALSCIDLLDTKLINVQTICRGDYLATKCLKELAESCKKVQAGWGRCNFGSYFVNLTNSGGYNTSTRLIQSASVVTKINDILGKEVNRTCCQNFEDDVYSGAVEDWMALAMDYKEVLAPTEDEEFEE